MTQVEQYGPYTAGYSIKTDRILAVTAGAVIRPVLRENTVRLRGRNTAPVITERTGPITAVKVPFYHSLRPENAL
ncbi:hypothetical protein I4U23_025696 [Adineta vaga]|nr:hypothetical protein I4U23_025696 [Adineta vaga]